MAVANLEKNIYYCEFNFNSRSCLKKSNKEKHYFIERVEKIKYKING